MRRGLALALVSLAAAGAHAQSAEQIVDRHLKASGGAKALRSIRGVRLRGTVNGGGEFLWVSQAPSAYYLMIRQDGGRAIEAFNGKSAWRQDEAGGLRTLTGNERAVARAEGAFRNDRFVAYAKDKTRVALLRRETVDGRAAHAVGVTSATGVQRTVFFDAQTYLVVKEEQQLASGMRELRFADYRAVAGVQEPRRILIRRGEETQELVVQETQHNPPLETAVFDFPRAAAASLPDVAELLKQVVENQKQLEQVRQDYAYVKTESDVEIDAAGRTKQKAERTYEGFYLAGDEIEKLVARDGRPIGADEAKKEQARVEKRIRERREKSNAGAGEQKEREQLTISQILRVCRLVNPRRERFRGQDVVVFDFEPRPGEKPKSRAESWMQKVSGNVFVDEQAKAIARVEARVDDSIKLGAGLVLSLHRGSSFVFEQELVRGEVWLPSYAEVTASARFLLLKGYQINQRIRFSDYKKFSVDSSSAIKPPGP